MARLIELVKHWKEELAVRFLDEEKKAEVQDIQSPVSIAHGALFIRQTWVLTSRNLLMGWRDPLGMSACWIKAVLMGIVCGLIFFNLCKDLAGICSCQGALYIASALQGYLIVLYETYCITNFKISVFSRKHGEGVISVTPWILAHCFAHIVQEDLVVSFLFSIIFWFICGFENNKIMYFKFFLIILLNQFISKIFAMFAALVLRDFAIVMLVVNLVFTVFMFSAGYFVQADSIPVYLHWTKWISYTFCSFAA
ncbi:hypothetical protein AAF712_003791 [Marasmius tenuissimus]|uniref:ABC-2 type transporter transmembrane domain-containing protein n=1 Tax=Marasmius tenuissimus TaxID=585030 RepID=A0ABR3A567_9AGAR